MCKVLIVPGIKKPFIKNAKRFMKEMGAEMSLGNRDGLGYAAIDSDGQLFGERWLDNSDAFKSETVVEVGDESKVIEEFDKLLKNKVPASAPRTIESTSFGTINLDDMVAFTLHTRMATSSKGMSNTHPFVSNDTSLIHNGVIRNVKDFDFKLSTCDSEAILISYLEHGVNKNVDAVSKMAESLTGYYACGVFSRDAAGYRILDVFKAHNNNLCVTFIKELDTFVLTSSEFDIKRVCEKLGWKFSAPMDFRDSILFRFNPFTGKVTETKEFTAGKEWEYVSNFSRGSTMGSSTPTVTHQSGTHSYNGATVIEYGKNKKKHNLSKQEIEYYRQQPDLSELNEHEALEWLKASGFEG